MDVHLLEGKTRPIWDEYVRGSSQATFFHLAGWQEVMKKTFGLTSYYLYAKEGDGFQGVLPLFHIKSRISGNFLTSIPGAVCAENETAAYALITRAEEIVKELDAEYLILRDSKIKWEMPELVTNDRFVTLVVELNESSTDLVSVSSRSARRAVKKAIKENLEVVDSKDTLARFYPVFSQAMHERGTPTLGYEFFQNIFDQFPEHFTIMMVLHGEEILGGGIIANFNNALHCTWAGMLNRFNDLGTNHLLYWEILKFGHRQGWSTADLGRSELDSGTFQFKSYWNSEPKSLYQQFFLNGISKPPAVGGTRAEEGQYQLFVNIWKRLPLSWAEILGPQLRRRMPFG